MVSNVTNVTSLTRSGLSDFVIQRVTAVILVVYTALVLWFFLSTPLMSYAALVGFFGDPIMKGFSTLAIVSTAAHAWIGMWTIGTDYIRPHYAGRHATAWRLLYQAICLGTIFVFTVWMLSVFWTIPVAPLS